MITEELLPQGVATLGGAAGMRPSLKFYGGRARQVEWEWGSAKWGCGFVIVWWEFGL